MKPLTYSPKDFQDMTALQRQLAEVLLRANREDRIHAILAIFAMLRLCRELLNKIPDGERNAQVEQVLVPFIRGEKAEGEGGRIITLH